MKLFKINVNFQRITFKNDGLASIKKERVYIEKLDGFEVYPKYEDIEKLCMDYCKKNFPRSEYFGIIGIEEVYVMENKDRVKPILEELGITPKDEWKTIHSYLPGERDFCYYYTFVIRDKEYCVSGDSRSFVFSVYENHFFLRTLYEGYDIEKLKKAIKKVLKK